MSLNIHLNRMVDSIDSKFKLSLDVKNAMLKIPREEFLPSGMSHISYNLDALPLGAKQFISSPFTVAKMTEYLQTSGCDSVLEIGCGSGYQAAILSCLFRRVFSIERIDRLRQEAIECFRKLSIMNINTKFGDGQEGWERFAPFDRILFSAGIGKIPNKIINQLIDGGILVAPIIQENGTQIITRFIKRSSNLHILDTKGICSFVSVKNDVENL